MTRRVAFFDLDKTLIPGSSLFLLARGLYDRDFVRVRDMVRWGWGQLRFRASGNEQMDFSQRVQEQALEFVKGRHRDELIALGREVAEDRILPRVYEDIARVIAQHSAEGDETWLFTAAPQELASVIADALGMTGAMGTRGELDDAGFFTGKLVGELLHGDAKAKAAERLAAERGLELRDSSAYSDSKNDLPLLELVGHAHAVNPDPALKRIARTRGWPIHELRSKRRALLIGIPSTVGAFALFGAGVALGAWVSKRSRD